MRKPQKPQIEQRLIIARAVVDMMQALIAMFAASHRTINYNKIAIEWCLLWGHLEHRPLTSGDAVKLSGLPRSTVQRMLAELVKTGIVRREGQTYRMTEARMNEVGVPVFTRQGVANIKRAAASLSKMGM